MKFKQLIVCALAVLMLSGSLHISAEAAEIKTTAKATAKEQTETIDENGVTNIKQTASSKEKDSQKESEKKEKYTKSQLRLLACLIYSEAGGEPYAGKLAVGIVVKNRVRSSRYPDTVSGVIYQRSQFGVVRNGALKKNLRAYDRGDFTSSREKACIKAAKAALSGVREVTYHGKTINMKGYYSFSGYVKNARLQIGNHQFK